MAQTLSDKDKRVPSRTTASPSAASTSPAARSSAGAAGRQRGEAEAQQGAASQSTQAQSQAQVQVPDKPRLAQGVELKGQMTESAFKNPPWLIDRGGHYVQVPELMYRVAEEANGEHTLADIAQAMSEKIQRKVSADNVAKLVIKLMALGLIQTAGGKTLGTQQGQKGGPSPLAVNMKMAMVSPKLIDPVTRVLKLLYSPPVLIVAVIAALLAQGWMYFVHGVGGSIHQALYGPGFMLAVLALMIVGTAFHEFGHATALHYGGGKVGGMGAGIYIVYPAFYTDVTDNYRLPRWSRVRTDLGGIYFNLIFCMAMMGLYLVTGWEFLLAVVLVINVEILHNLLPFVRLDGYWTLADITGIPDFFSHIVPFLRSQLPAWAPLPEGREIPELKTWAKWFFWIYILITIPLLIVLLFLMIKSVPRVLGTFWDALGQQAGAFSQALSQGNVLGLLATGFQILLLALPTLALLYTLYSLGKRLVVGVWHWSQGSAQRKLVAGLGSVGVVALLAFLWAPQIPFLGGRPGPLYNTVSFAPIQPNERFAVSDIVRGVIVTVTPSAAQGAAGAPTATPAGGTGTPAPTAIVTTAPTALTSVPGLALTPAATVTRVPTLGAGSPATIAPTTAPIVRATNTPAAPAGPTATTAAGPTATVPAAQATATTAAGPTPTGQAAGPTATPAPVEPTAAATAVNPAPPTITPTLDPAVPTATPVPPTATP